MTDHTTAADAPTVDATTTDARTAAVEALLRMRDAAGQVFSSISESQPLAPHHLLALRVVADGAATLNDVAAATDRHVSSVSRVIDQLVTEELLSRRPHPEDRRQVVLAPTTRGRVLVDRFAALDRSLAARMLDGFRAEDARRLAGYLDQLAGSAARLAADLEADPGLLGAERGNST